MTELGFWRSQRKQYYLKTSKNICFVCENVDVSSRLLLTLIKTLHIGRIRAKLIIVFNSLNVDLLFAGFSLIYPYWSRVSCFPSFFRSVKKPTSVGFISVYGECMLTQYWFHPARRWPNITKNWDNLAMLAK